MDPISEVNKMENKDGLQETILSEEHLTLIWIMADFPAELLYQLFQYFSYFDRCARQRVCKRWNAVLASRLLRTTIGIEVPTTFDDDLELTTYEPPFSIPIEVRIAQQVIFYGQDEKVMLKELQRYIEQHSEGMNEHGSLHFELKTRDCNMWNNSMYIFHYPNRLWPLKSEVAPQTVIICNMDMCAKLSQEDWFSRILKGRVPQLIFFRIRIPLFLLPLLNVHVQGRTGQHLDTAVECFVIVHIRGIEKIDPAAERETMMLPGSSFFLIERLGYKLVKKHLTPLAYQQRAVLRRRLYKSSPKEMNVYRMFLSWPMYYEKEIKEAECLKAPKRLDSIHLILQKPDIAFLLYWFTEFMAQAPTARAPWSS